ncbi:MAG: tRNA pseudouridine(38-40) synthase TruA [Parachlamydiaceae bacterium]
MSKHANIKLVVAYDGTNFLGWQKTKTGRSVEEELEKVLTQVLQHEIKLQAASRTDAGVHATGQVVNFFTTKDISFSKLHIALNSLLPQDVAVVTVDEMPEAFHPTLDCTGKEYHYNICYGITQLPHRRLYSWHSPHKFEIAKMDEAIPFLIGSHDFSSFCNTKKNEEYTDSVRDLQQISIVNLPDNTLRFELRGNSFLYKMVRNLVGTLVYVGQGKIQSKELPGILAARSRPLAGVTAPAHGLFLHQVLFSTP